MTSNTLSLVSMYLAAPVSRAHAIHLTLTEIKLGFYKGQLALDPNLCSLNAFGDRAGCTKMAVFVHDVTGSVIRLGDPAHLGRGAVELHWEGQGEDQWLLIEFSRANAWYLVVASKDARVVVPLYAADAFVAPSADVPAPVA